MMVQGATETMRHVRIGRTLSSGRRRAGARHARCYTSWQLRSSPFPGGRHNPAYSTGRRSLPPARHPTSSHPTHLSHLTHLTHLTHPTHPTHPTHLSPLAHSSHLIWMYMASGEAKNASRRVGWVLPSSEKWGRAKLSPCIATRMPLFSGHFSSSFTTTKIVT